MGKHLYNNIIGGIKCTYLHYISTHIVKYLQAELRMNMCEQWSSHRHRRDKAINSGWIWSWAVNGDWCVAQQFVFIIQTQSQTWGFIWWHFWMAINWIMYLNHDWLRKKKCFPKMFYPIGHRLYCSSWRYEGFVIDITYISSPLTNIWLFDTAADNVDSKQDQSKYWRP